MAMTKEEWIEYHLARAPTPTLGQWVGANWALGIEVPPEIVERMWREEADKEEQSSREGTRMKRAMGD